MGRAATAPVVVASANASAFKGAAVTARVKRSTRAARVQSRRTAVLTQAKVSRQIGLGWSSWGFGRAHARK